jgi:ribosome production factor 2
LSGIRKAKTHKGRKIIENKEAKIVENAKTAIFLRGNKISGTISSLISELHILRGIAEASRLHMRKAQDIQPFDNVGPLEQLASK